MECYYMEITRDKYELPVAVAESMTELANMCGVKVSTICHSVNRKNKQKVPHKYVRVLMDDEGGDQG